MNIDWLKADLERDEGRVPYAYDDADGKPVVKGSTVQGYVTCGIGFLIDKSKGGKIPDEVIDYWLNLLVVQRNSALIALFTWFHTLNDARQNVLINMSFQLGVDGLMEFKHLLRACQEHDFDTAADEILDSKAARQAPDRFQRHAITMRTGERDG